MSAIALIGSVTLVLRESTLEKILLPLVSFAAGSLIGGALFHMIPASLATMPVMSTVGWIAVGFVLFFALEQFLHWHHCATIQLLFRIDLPYRWPGRLFRLT